MARTRGSAQDCDVLIVGGGPSGLCMSIGLSALGVRSRLVERHPGTAINPKALHLSARTMEIFRAWGVVDDVRARALPSSDHAMFLGSSLADPGFVRHPIWPANPDVSPESSTLVSQEILEPVLRERAEAGPGSVEFDMEMTDLRVEDGGAVVTLRDRLTGSASEVRARFVIGADGADSAVRDIAGIAFDGHDVHYSMNLRFTADLTDLLADRRSAFYYVQNQTVRGLLPVVDNTSDWRLHIVMAPGETAQDYADESRQLTLIRAAVGVADLEPELLPGFEWTAAARVASSYRNGPLFLVGDAAHVNPPSGGLGMNCGLQDAHNLAWKIAAVLRGGADESLLDTYEQERRPVALRTVDEAELNHEYEAAPVHSDADRERKHKRRRQDGLVLGFAYPQGAFMPDSTDLPWVADEYSDFVPSARPGQRAPHLWLDKHGVRTSILDCLTWSEPVLVLAAEADSWAQAAAALSIRTFRVGVAGVEDPDRQLGPRYGIGSAGAVLVRQDGIVGFRSAEAAPTVEAGVQELTHAMAVLRGSQMTGPFAR